MRNDFRLINGDCFNELAKFKDEFDLIFADPPYFLSNGGLSIQSGQIVSVNKGKWDEGTNIDEIDEFNLKWLKLAKRSLSDNGSIMISGTYHNIFSIGRALQKLDYKILNIITWQKTNPPPNFKLSSIFISLNLSLNFIKFASSSAFRLSAISIKFLLFFNTNKIST